MSPKSSLARYSAYEMLPNGTRLHIRAVSPDDRDALHAAFFRQSHESITSRFLHAKGDLSEQELDYYTRVDFQHHIALAAEVNGTSRGETRGVGVARCIRSVNEPATADAAFIIDDAWHGKGVCKVLIKHLALLARRVGVERFEADVRADNAPMLAVFAKLGPMKQRYVAGGLVHISVDLDGARAKKHLAAELPEIWL
jgi:RimJ/RimL family protein N-acetyltransferase